MPSSAAGGGQAAAYATGAYAIIRRQFNTSIANFEGVGEALTRIAGNAYTMNAAISVTSGAIDQGEKPAVPSAILKYHCTELGRKVGNDAMDVHAGKGLCDGPSNLLFNGYAGIPIAITVEGANILTRSLIIFAQGSIRCHPWLLKELMAAKQSDPATGLDEFDRALRGHVAYVLGNFAGALIHNLTGARLVPAPSADSVSPRTRKWYRHLGRAVHSAAQRNLV